MTAKIIKTDGDKAILGFDDGTFREVSWSDLGFRADEGQLVDVYDNGDKSVYTKHTAPAPMFTIPTNVVNSDHYVNKLVYILLAFFFGGFGIHKFYAGHTSTGVAYLIATISSALLIIPVFIVAILVLIDIIKACMANADASGNIIL